MKLVHPIDVSTYRNHPAINISSLKAFSRSPLQIHRGVVLDVNRITGSNYRHSEMTNRAQARAVCEAYLRHYGKGATPEQLARRWNGGPRGDTRPSTEAYWAKVKKHLK